MIRLSALSHQRRRPGSALTWIPDAALREFTGIDEPLSALVAAATRLQLDAALVDASAADSVARAQVLLAAGVAPIWAVAGPVSRVAARLGYSECIALSARDPRAFISELDADMPAALAAVSEGVSAGVSIILIADELAGAQGWLIAPDLAADELMPRYRELAGSRGAVEAVAFHSDGDIRQLYPALAGAGFTAVHVASVDADTCDACFVAARASALLPLGGVPVAGLVHPDTTAAEAVRRTQGAPAIICDDGGMTTCAQMLAYERVLEVARRAHPAGDQEWD